MTTTFTAGAESITAEDFVNDAYTAGKSVTVNGVEVWHRFGVPATSWDNGSFSYSSRATTAKNGTRQNWVKAGETIRVTAES